MLKFCVLGSGSKGNSVWFNVDGTEILIDVGFTKKEINKRLGTIGRNIDNIDHIFITHDHGDHLHPWLTKESGKASIRAFIHGAKVHDFPLMKGAKVESFPLSHDSDNGSFGYVIKDKAGNKIAILMDTGCVPEEVIPYLFDCAVVMIETNYSIEMLIDSPYPTELQERIASDKGHLRDQCAAEVVGMVAWPGLKYVVGLHLSSKCINPALSRFELETAVKDLPGCEVIVSDQVKPTDMMVVM